MVPSMWLLPMATTMNGLVARVAMALVAMETTARGRRCSPFMHIWTFAVLSGTVCGQCPIGRVRVKIIDF